jgi:hypothetical protein
MILREKKLAYRHQIKAFAGGDKATVDSVLEVLFPYESCGDFDVYHWDSPYNTSAKRVWWQRLNYIWILPIFYVFVLPFQWVVKGRVGFDNRTRIGRIVLKLIGVDNE